MVSSKINAGILALLEGAPHILNLFGKSAEEIGTEYKSRDGDTPRTLIDTNSEREILRVLKTANNCEFSKDCFNAEESEWSGDSRRIWHIDPYDGTSNAQISLPTSTMGIGIQEDGDLVGSIIVHPFEKKLFYAEKGQGAFFHKLNVIQDGKQINKLYFQDEPQEIHTDLESDTAKTRYAWVDSLFNDKTTSNKLNWIAEMQRAALMQNVRITGSNIDYSSKIAQGRGHYQLTDAVGGFFDLCGYNLIEEAGGRMVNLNGEQPTLKDKVVIAVANPRDLERVLEITKRCYNDYKGFR